MVKKFTVIYNETVTHWFDVEAENEEEAMELFNCQIENGDIDFCHGEVTDSSIEVVENG